ncbi:Pentatricopeptide repeat [Trinorchestia longiramus]|nr:Pentatricopeptide repeat [Trinorchestia longiramus]
MSALLRSIGIVRSLKNFAETSVCLRALKPCSTNIASKNFHIQSARFFAVQHKSLRLSEQDGYMSKLSNMLERLNTDGRRLGRISFDLFQDVVFQIKQTNSVSSSQALVVLRCCGSIMPEELPSARTELAHSLWQIFENRGLPLDLSHYNALLRIYIENEHGFSPSEFLERLKCKHIEPNRVTYQRLIMRYAQLGDIEGATSILEVMKERNLPINDNIFHALILGHSRAG